MKPHVFALSVGLTWLSIPQATMAQVQGAEEADSARAGVRFQRAVELYREGSYEGALAEFRKAHQLSPSYRVLYNIAQTQYALHDFVSAHKSLKQYVSEGAGEIPADRRTQVDEMSAKLEERIGHLQIATNVTGADIQIDDISVGTSPLPDLVSVNVGAHKVSVSKIGFPPAIRMLTVAGRESLQVELRIEIPSAAATKSAASVVTPASSLVVKTQPEAASSRTGLIVSLSATAAFAIGTGVFGYLALSAQQDLKNQANTYPNTRSNIEDAREKSKTYGYITDALGAATLLSAGVAAYYLFSRHGDSWSPKSEKSRTPLVLSPTVGGMVLQGSF